MRANVVFAVARTTFREFWRSPDAVFQALGANLYYDFRQGKKGNYNQIGLGLEALGNRWEMRGNGYIPISVNQHIDKCVFNKYIGNFFAVNEQFESSSYGFNAEVGYYIVQSENFSLFAAAGPYYFAGKKFSGRTGGEFRIRPQYRDYLAVEASVSHDNFFGTVYQARVTLILPLYQMSTYLKTKSPISNRIIYQTVDRNQVIPLENRCCWKRNF